MGLPVSPVAMETPSNICLLAPPRLPPSPPLLLHPRNPLSGSAVGGVPSAPPTGSGGGHGIAADLREVHGGRARRGPVEAQVACGG